MDNLNQINPLIETCLEISRAGYDKRDELNVKYMNPKLMNFASYLLNNSGLDRTFHVKPKIPDVDHCKDHVAICFGGGIDSYEALIYALQNNFKVTLIHVNYGQPYYESEASVFSLVTGAWYETFNWDSVLNNKAFVLDFIRLVKKHDLKKDDLKFVRSSVNLVKDAGDVKWENYIFPARNLVLAAIGVQYAPNVWIVANKRENESVGTPDKTSRFFRESTSLFSDFYGFRVSVSSPFLNKSKLQATRSYLEEGGNADCLRITSSCYSPARCSTTFDFLHCGECYACWKRYQLFQALNLEHEFVTHPMKSVNADKYAEKERSKGR